MISLNKSVAMTDGGGGIKKKKNGSTQSAAETRPVTAAAGAGTGQAVQSVPGSTAKSQTQTGKPWGSPGIPSTAEKKRFASMQRQPDSTATIQSMVPQAAEKRAFAQRRYQDNQQSSGDQEDLPDSNEPSIGSMAFDTVGWGAGKINGVATSTLDFLANLPSRLEGTLFGEDAEGTFFGQLLKPITDAVGKLNDYTHNTTDKLGTYLNEQTKDNKAANLAVNYGSDLIAAAPIAILALLSGGGSAAAQLGPPASGLAETTYQVLSNMAKNPIYWANVAKYLGPKYDQAIANGATENEALVSALLSAPVNAAVDSKGGTEALPQRTRSGVHSTGEKVQKLLSSAMEEGAEGFAQDTLDNLVDKAVYDKDKPYFSTTDEHVVLNPKVAAANAVSDMTTATMLGSGQLLTDAAATRLRNAWEQKRLAWAVSGENLRANDLGEDTVRAALAMPEGTEARNLAEQATVTRQAEILSKLEELEAAKKQAGAIQTPRQLQAFMKTVGRLEQELDALEQGRLSDRLDSETLGRLAEAVQNGQAQQAAGQAFTHPAAQDPGKLTEQGKSGNLNDVVKSDFYASSKGKVLPSKYKDWLGENQRGKYISSADDQHLKKIIGEIYRPGSIIGDGGTADSIRFERETGILLCRAGHIQKGRDMIRCLERFLETDSLSENDQLQVQQLLSDLREAVEGG